MGRRDWTGSREGVERPSPHWPPSARRPVPALDFADEVPGRQRAPVTRVAGDLAEVAEHDVFIRSELERAVLAAEFEPVFGNGVAQARAGRRIELRAVHVDRPVTDEDRLAGQAHEPLDVDLSGRIDGAKRGHFPPLGETSLFTRIRSPPATVDRGGRSLLICRSPH